MSHSSTTSRAGAWTLEVPTKVAEAADVQAPDDGRKEGTESIIGEDLRTLVPSTDIQDGGKYRCKFRPSCLVGVITHLATQSTTLTLAYCSYC
jgi:hypothetical protein